MYTYDYILIENEKYGIYYDSLNKRLYTNMYIYVYTHIYFLEWGYYKERDNNVFV